MRWLILSIGVVLSVAIQSTWLAALHLPAQVTPDLVLIMAISYGLLRGPDAGLLFGLGAGLFVDLISGGGLIGVQALSKMAAGFSAGFMEKNIFKDNLLVPVIAVFVGTLVCESFNILMYIAFNANYQFFSTLFFTILPLAVFNALLAPIVYHLLLRMERRFSKE
ncbi:MAG TPA: rod shape-determining protein MreD [Bacillota bacterium]